MVILIFGRKQRSASLENDDGRVTKLFFDSFSKRVSTVEERLKRLSKEVENLHISVDRSQISDLVLLERLQKAERLLEESLSWIKRVADSVGSEQGGAGIVTSGRPTGHARQANVAMANPVSIQGIASPVGGSASLSSITTPTELQVLALLSEQGPKSAPEVGRLVGRSREHSARLMRKLFEEGYVTRDQSRIPFRYSPVERVRASFKKEEKKDEAREEAAVAPA